MEGTKRCSWCKQDKPRDEFHRHSRTRDGRQPICKGCTKSSAWKESIQRTRRRRLERDPRWDLRHRLRYRYGITLDEYRAREAYQRGLCAICGEPEWRRIKGRLSRLSVDHDHETSLVRALLCHQCNTALGVVEQLSWVREALRYLRAHGKGHLVDDLGADIMDGEV